MIVGLAIRLFLAPLPGHTGDLSINQSWMDSAVLLGVADSFDHQVEMKYPPNHGPVEIYLYYASGRLYQKFISPQYDIVQPANRIFLKFPAILADLWICVLLFIIFRKTRSNAAGLLAAAVYALQPAAIYTSAFWGQTDSIWVAFVLSAFVALDRNWYSTASACVLIACLHKPQAMIFLPLFAFVFPWRLHDILRALNAVAATLAILLLPFYFHGNLPSGIRVISTAFIVRGELSVNAYNFWWILFGPAARAIQPRELLLPFISYHTVGTALFLGIYGSILLALRKRLRGQSHDRIEVILVAGSIIASAFFLFSTSIHERYLFPFLLFGMPFLFRGRKGALLYIIISLVFLFNLILLHTLSKMSPIFSAHSSIMSVIAAWCMSLLFFPHYFLALRFRNSPLHHQADAVNGNPNPIDEAKHAPITVNVGGTAAA